MGLPGHPRGPHMCWSQGRGSRAGGWFLFHRAWSTPQHHPHAATYPLWPRSEHPWTLILLLQQFPLFPPPTSHPIPHFGRPFPASKPQSRDKTCSISNPPQLHSKTSPGLPLWRKLFAAGKRCKALISSFPVIHRRARMLSRSLLGAATEPGPCQHYPSWSNVCPGWKSPWECPEAVPSGVEECGLEGTSPLARLPVRGGLRMS